jgi:hypothetical protein
MQELKTLVRPWSVVTFSNHSTKKQLRNLCSDGWFRVEFMCEFKLVVVQLTAYILQHQREYFVWEGLHQKVRNILFFNLDLSPSSYPTVHKLI